MDSESDSDLDLINNIRAPKERQFRQRIDFLETLEDNDFKQRFRVNKETFLILMNEIRDEISPKTDRYGSSVLKFNFITFLP